LYVVLDLIEDSIASTSWLTRYLDSLAQLLEFDNDVLQWATGLATFRCENDVLHRNHLGSDEGRLMFCSFAVSDGFDAV
jgi:hypothetical protein